MSHDTQTDLNSDSPINNREEDALGYWPFANAVGRGIVGRVPKDSFVVGIQAQWGMGKTSAVNLILQAIREAEAGTTQTEKTHVTWFNPWLFTGLDTLVDGYLGELARAIDKVLPATASRRTKKLLKGLRKHAGVIGNVAAAGGTVATTGMVPFGELIKPLTKWLGQGQSLESKATDLKADLAQLPGRVLVVLDDLDRLQPHELRQILTLVKTFGNLPRVTHMLVYDRSIIDANLEMDGNRGRTDANYPTYLEKIIQAEFDLPTPTRAGLGRLMNSKLPGIFGDYVITQNMDWANVWHVAYGHYLKSPRDIVRFTNALSIAWPPVVGEVYLPDFIAVELFRTGERQVYDFIRANKELLIGRDNLVSSEESKAWVVPLMSRLKQSNKGIVAALLRQMFPALDKLMGDQNFFSGGRLETKLEGRGIGTDEGFDLYFGFAPPAEELTVAEIAELNQNFEDPAFLRGRFEKSLERRRSDGKSFSGPLLTELYLLAEQGNKNVEPLLGILMEFGDRLLEVDRQFEMRALMEENDRRLIFLFDCMKGKIEKERLLDLTIEFLKSPSTGPNMGAFFVAHLAGEYGLIYRMRDNGEPKSLPLEQIHTLIKMVADGLDALAADGRLIKSPLLWMQLRFWETVTKKADILEWINAEVQTPEGFTAIAFSLTNRTQGNGQLYPYRAYSGGADPEIFDLEYICACGEKHLHAQSIRAEDVNDARRFIDAIKGKKSRPTTS